MPSSSRNSTPCSYSTTRNARLNAVSRRKYLVQESLYLWVTKPPRQPRLSETLPPPIPESFVVEMSNCPKDKNNSNKKRTRVPGSSGTWSTRNGDEEKQKAGLTCNPASASMRPCGTDPRRQKHRCLANPFRSGPMMLQQPRSLRCRKEWERRGGSAKRGPKPQAPNSDAASDEPSPQCASWTCSVPGAPGIAAPGSPPRLHPLPQTPAPRPLGCSQCCGCAR